MKTKTTSVEYFWESSKEAGSFQATNDVDALQHPKAKAAILVYREFLNGQIGIKWLKTATGS